MKLFKIVGVVFFTVLIMAVGAEIGERLSIPEAQRLVPPAEARAGRPLTPVNVAGVARRCAVGVYNCSLPGSRFLTNLLDCFPSFFEPTT